MAYIYMDESGDLGFDLSKTKTSRNFLITCVLSENKRTADKVVRKYFKHLPEKIRRTHCGTFHCNCEQSKFRSKMFDYIRDNDDLSVMVVRLNKEKVFTNLQEKNIFLYNYVVNIILDRMINRKLVDTKDGVEFIASQRETNRFLNQNFKDYISNKVMKAHKIKITTSIKTPSQEKGLQIADACSWAMFRKYEHKDETFYNMIKNNIVEDNTLF